MKTRVQASTPSRISLFGEYNRLVGESIAIALADIKTTCTVELSSKNHHTFKSKNLDETKLINNLETPLNDWPDYISGAIQILGREFDVDIPFFNITIDSSIPIGSGLASSSSLTLSALNGVCNILNIKKSKIELAKLAYLVESKILGIPCGLMDPYTCSLGGVVYINNLKFREPLVIRYTLPSDTVIVVCNSGTQKNTKHVIEDVTRRYESGNKKILLHIKTERKLIKDARRVLAAGKPSLMELGKLINIAQKSFKYNLQSSNELLDTMCSTAIKAGAYGAKISGGGFGGSIFALTDKANARKVEHALAIKNKHILTSKIYG